VPDYGSVTRDRDGDPLSGTDSDSGSDRGTPDYGTDDNSLPGGNLAGGSGSQSSSPTPEQLDELGSQLQSNFSETISDQLQTAQEDFNQSVQQLEDQFNSEISQTESNFNSQIDNVTGSVTDIQSNLNQQIDGLGQGLSNLSDSVSESFSSVGSGLQSTQNAVGSLSGSLARLFNQESESGSEPEGLSTTALAAAGAVLVGITYYVTQRDQ